MESPFLSNTLAGGHTAIQEQKINGQLRLADCLLHAIVTPLTVTAAPRVPPGRSTG